MPRLRAIPRHTRAPPRPVRAGLLRVKGSLWTMTGMAHFMLEGSSQDVGGNPRGPIQVSEGPFLVLREPLPCPLRMCDLGPLRMCEPFQTREDPWQASLQMPMGCQILIQNEIFDF